MGTPFIPWQQGSSPLGGESSKEGPNDGDHQGSSPLGGESVRPRPAK